MLKVDTWCNPTPAGNSSAWNKIIAAKENCRKWVMRGFMDVEGSKKKKKTFEVLKVMGTSTQIPSRSISDGGVGLQIKQICGRMMHI